MLLADEWIVSTSVYLFSSGMSYSQASKKYGVPLEDLKEMGTTIEKQTL